MTQGELQAALGLIGFKLSVNSIGYYERGERAPDFDDLRNIAIILAADHFDVDENLRIEFNKNGKPHPEPLPQQLDLNFDENSGVTIRIQSARDGIIIKKMLA